MKSKSWVFRFLSGVEWLGNKLPHPFWLFCLLCLAVTALSAVLSGAGVSALRPEAQILKTSEDGQRVEGRSFTVDESFEGFTINLENASRSSRLSNIFVELYSDERLVHEERIDRSELQAFQVTTERLEVLRQPGHYRLALVNRAQLVEARSLISKEGLNWFVLSMVENFAHFEPLGLVLVMLMGVAIAEGAGLIPAVMRGVALGVPKALITPTLFAVAACGNIGSDAGIVVVPPLAAAIYKQLGRNPITGLLVGYVGATAGFTANLVPAGTDVLAMSLTNAASGGDPEINVFANWYFMAVSVFLLAIIGTVVTRLYVEPRLGGVTGGATAEIEPLTAQQKKGIAWAGLALAITLGIWLLTILPENGLLRHPDPDPNMFWRSNFFRGLIPVLFTLFTVGGVVYGYTTGSVSKADDVIGFMADSMRRMSGYIVLVLVIGQFTRAFQFANMDQLIAIGGANGLRAVGFEDLPIPFFVAFILMIAVANLFMGSASAKWAIFAPIFVPMLMSLGFHPGFTQLLYRIGDSITNCVSPLYPYFPLLLGWIADVDRARSRVGTVLSYLVPYAVFLLVGWTVMLVLWYLTGVDIGPDTPLRWGG
jgi:aminobenzoyl-glutamate transport protein